MEKENKSRFERVRDRILTLSGAQAAAGREEAPPRGLGTADHPEAPPNRQLHMDALAHGNMTSTWFSALSNLCLS